jgi:endonuclease YncB( thermonuclease family)
METAVLMVCAVLSVVDGDTVKCDGQNLRPMGAGAPYVSGFDTPEPDGRADCLAEQMLAELASRRIGELIDTPGLRIEDSGEVDQFERPLVWLHLPDGSTVGETMIAEGYAEEWLPDRPVNWCE